MECIQRYVPLRKKKQSHTNPWITRDIIHLKRNISRSRLKQKTGADTLTSYICSLGSELQQMIKDAKDLYFTKTLHNILMSSPSKFWEHFFVGKKDIRKFKLATSI